MEEKKDKNEDMKITINLFDAITEKESAEQKTINLKECLVDLIDDYLQKQVVLSEEQRGQLARLRSRIIIDLTLF